MMRRCTECDQLVRVVDPENGCRPWLAEHRTANGKRKCDGSLTGQYVEDGPMAEQNEDLSNAGGNRLKRAQMAREFLAKLPPGTKYHAAKAAASEAGIVLGPGAFYRHLKATGREVGTPARTSKPDPFVGTVGMATPGGPLLPSALGTPPAIDAIRELAQLVPRLGGFAAAKSALTLLEELAAATGGAP